MSYAILNPSLGVKPTIQTASVFVAEGPSVGRRVPSTLSADGNASQWGPFIPSGAKTLRLLKLSLPHEEDLPDHPDHSRGLDEVREAIRMIRHVAGMKGITAVARYLRALWDGCSPEVMVQAFPALLEDMAVRIVFTIPASWREDAISRMRDAVLASGIPNIGRGLATIEFLTESEAAALAILPGLVQSRSCKVPLHHYPFLLFSYYPRPFPHLFCHQLQTVTLILDSGKKNKTLTLGSGRRFGGHLRLWRWYGCEF